jgi:ribosomal protein S18 acetylase RimI-like enzyme
MKLLTVSVKKIATEAERRAALRVLRVTYRREKHWVDDEAQVFPDTERTNPSVSWFLASVGSMPAGVLRVLYDPPVEEYRRYALTLVEASFDIESFLRQNRLAEIGRFAVRPRFRVSSAVASHLMRAAAEDAARRRCDYFITDVFEGEQHSPYEFHRRVLGFQTVATHETGELHCAHRRVTMLLDLREAYLRLRKRQRRFFKFLTEGWDESLHRQFSS